MNPETLLNLAAVAIESRPVACGKQYRIAIVEGTIVCVSAAQPIPRSQICGTFSDDELRQGLTPKQWKTLKKTLALRFFLTVKP